MGLQTGLLCLTALFAGCALAGEGVPEAPSSEPLSVAAPADAQQPWRDWKAVLFRVQVPNGPVNFVLGTIHFGTADELGVDDDVMFEALKHMTLLVNEVDGASPWDAADERYRTLPDGSGLPGLIGEPAFAELTRLLPRVPVDWLRKLKPWAALALLEARGEVADGQTMDERLERRATALGLPAEHLETLAEQLRALDCASPGEHAVVLEQRLRTPWLFAEESARVLDYYRHRNLAAWLDEVDAMVGLDAQARAVEDRSRRCLIEDRNLRWMPRLDALLRRGGAFVAVGAIHLTGEFGLLEQLRRRGFDIVAEPL